MINVDLDYTPENTSIIFKELLKYIFKYVLLN